MAFPSPLSLLPRHVSPRLWLARWPVRPALRCCPDPAIVCGHYLLSPFPSLAATTPKLLLYRGACPCHRSPFLLLAMAFRISATASASGRGGKPFKETVCLRG